MYMYMYMTYVSIGTPYLLEDLLHGKVKRDNLITHQ